MKPRLVMGLPALLIVAAQALHGQAAPDRADLDAIYRIKDEGFRRSEVMEITAELSDVYGPRLTGSPAIKAAADYLAGRMKKWGLANVTLEPWGPFAPGWTNERFVAYMEKPQSLPLLGLPKAWTPGTEGPITAEAVMVKIETEEDFATYRGKLRGRFILSVPPAEVLPLVNPPFVRFTDDDLAELAKAPSPTDPTRRAYARELTFHRKKMKFLLDEEVAALVEPGRGAGGVFFVETGVFSRDPRDHEVPAQVVLATEHYNRLARLIARNVPVTLHMDIGNTFYTENLDSFTVIGEIAGTDKADEVVMLGAHLDSWHGATGATDNAAGVAVMLEAMRILKATSLKPRRTIRVALWTGEEQGRLGSRAYIEEHFVDAKAKTVKPDHAKLSVYFNLDMGGGAIRGVYLQGNEAVAPVFKAWMEPFRNLGMTTLAIREMAGTDHISFDEVGLPGFQFIQDPLEYRSLTHHFNMDTYDRIPVDDMLKNAVIVASFAYQAANRDERLPRKPLPARLVPAGRTTSTAPGRQF